MKLVLYPLFRVFRIIGILFFLICVGAIGWDIFLWAGRGAFVFQTTMNLLELVSVDFANKVFSFMSGGRMVRILNWPASVTFGLLGLLLCLPARSMKA